MQTPIDYLGRTESAVRKFFEEIDRYLGVLRQFTGTTFVTSLPPGPKQDAAFAAWQQENRARLESARRAEREYLAEAFALDTLCGAVLQVACKALEMYSRNGVVPSGLPPEVKAKHARYCVGRLLRTLPVGLIVYAARNQHTHFNDDSLLEPNAAVFRRLATGHGFAGNLEVVDPAFDPATPSLVSYAGNVTALIGWRSFDAYDWDMREMLHVSTTSCTGVDSGPC